MENLVLCDTIFTLGENDVEYAEFSMAQRMLLRESSPNDAVGVTSPTRSGSSMEDKFMLFSFLDKHEHSNNSNTLESDSTWQQPSFHNTSSTSNCKIKIPILLILLLKTTYS